MVVYYCTFLSITTCTGFILAQCWQTLSNKNPGQIFPGLKSLSIFPYLKSLTLVNSERNFGLWNHFQETGRCAWSKRSRENKKSNRIHSYLSPSCFFCKKSIIVWIHISGNQYSNSSFHLRCPDHLIDFPMPFFNYPI